MDTETGRWKFAAVGIDGEGPPPSEAARKRAAVELIRAEEQTLRRTARRYSSCEDDADDAYQRALEILLTKAPTTDQRQLIKWMQTVTKHEAFAVRKQRERILHSPPPGADAQQDWLDLIPAVGDGPEVLAERHDKVARCREALKTLKPGELHALTLLAQGYSYEEIGNRTGWSYTGGIQHRPPTTVQVRIDRTEPGIAFTNAQDPNDPELLKAVVSDGLSGAATGQIEFHRAGSSDAFTSLPTDLVGSTLEARWPSDDYPAGEYEFRAVATDAAGNAARSSARSDGTQMVLPNPLKVPTAVRVKFGKPVGRISGTKTRTTAYGKATRISGRLTAGLGSPLTGELVTVTERFNAGSTRRLRATRVRTDARGLFAANLLPGPSRAVSVT